MTVSLHIIAIGKNKDRALQSLIDDYIRRMSWGITITEIAPPNVSDAERKQKEATLLMAAIPERSVVLVLDERGDMLDSVAFAGKLDHLFTTQSQAISFVIGGADGLDESIRNHAHGAISFGKMTWPHMLVRLMLVEQLYRAATILSGHPYHRI